MAVAADQSSRLMAQSLFECGSVWDVNARTRREPALDSTSRSCLTCPPHSTRGVVHDNIPLVFHIHRRNAKAVMQTLLSIA